MNSDLGHWTYGLLFASLMIVLGIIGLVPARRAPDLGLASSLLLQGVLMTFVVGAAHTNISGNSKLGALTIVGLLLIPTVWGAGLADDQPNIVKDQPE